MPYGEKSDANFFALVHHVLESTRSDAPRDQRICNRHPFTCDQYVAPFRDGRMPSSQDFDRVQFQDLSPSGFSFYSPHEFDCEYLVAALGVAPYLYVSAAIVHTWPELVKGQQLFFIGCRILSRLANLEYVRPLGVQG